MSDLKNTIRSINDENEDLHQKILELETADANCKKYQKQAETFRDELNEEKLRRSDLELMVQRMEATVSDLTSEKKRIEVKHGRLEERFNALTIDLEKKKTELQLAMAESS